jgi:hypothetical protein
MQARVAGVCLVLLPATAHGQAWPGLQLCRHLMHGRCPVKPIWGSKPLMGLQVHSYYGIHINNMMNNVLPCNNTHICITNMCMLHTGCQLLPSIQQRNKNALDASQTCVCAQPVPHSYLVHPESVAGGPLAITLCTLLHSQESPASACCWSAVASSVY